MRFLHKISKIKIIFANENNQNCQIQPWILTTTTLSTEKVLSLQKNNSTNTIPTKPDPDKAILLPVTKATRQ